MVIEKFDDWAGNGIWIGQNWVGIPTRLFFYWTEPSMGDNPAPAGKGIPINSWQRSSGVEQRTHKPFVGGSNPPAATIVLKASIPLSGVGALFLVDYA